MDKAIDFLVILQVGIALLPVSCWILAGRKWYQVGQKGKTMFWKVFGIATSLMILGIVLIHYFAPVKNGIPSKMILLQYPIVLCWGIIGLVLLLRANNKLKKRPSQ